MCFAPMHVHQRLFIWNIESSYNLYGIAVYAESFEMEADWTALQTKLCVGPLMEEYSPLFDLAITREEEDQGNLSFRDG